MQAWPSFGQVLTVRLVPGTVRALVGHPLGDGWPWATVTFETTAS